MLSCSFEWYKICNNQVHQYGYILLSCTVQKKLAAGSCYMFVKAVFPLAKFTMIMPARATYSWPLALATYEYGNPFFWSQLNVQKFMLSFSFSFKCDQIDDSPWYVFGHTLLCFSSSTWIFKRGRFVEQRLILSSSFRCDQIYKIRDMILVTLCCAT